MAQLTTRDREQIEKAAKESGKTIKFEGTNRTIIDQKTEYGDHQALKKLKGN